MCPATPVLDLDYAYDLAGRITGIDDAGGGARGRDYAWDALHRLTQGKELAPGGAPVTLQTDYTYDAAGNRLTRDAGGALETLAYDAASNRLETVTAGAAIPAAGPPSLDPHHWRAAPAVPCSPRNVWRVPRPTARVPMPLIEDKPQGGAKRRHPGGAAARPFSLSGFSVRAGTAFIPLLARARARTQFPELGFVDEEAERIVAALGVPADLFGGDPGWMRGVVCRARWFDARCRRFLTANPDGLGIALGAGLDTRFRRLGGAARRWVDLDLPEVIALRRRFVRPTARHRMLACDVTDPAWTGRVGWRPGEPVVLTAEGLLMYLAPAELRRLFRAIAARFAEGGAPAAVLLDYASPLAALNSWLHPAIAHTAARFRSGLAGAAAVRRIDRRFRVVEDRDIARACGPAGALAAALHEMMTMGGFLHGLAHLELAGGSESPAMRRPARSAGEQAAER